jgi:uncharacterized protein (TIGR04141 family)
LRRIPSRLPHGSRVLERRAARSRVAIVVPARTGVSRPAVGEAITRLSYRLRTRTRNGILAGSLLRAAFVGSLSVYRIKPEFTNPDDIIADRDVRRVESVKLGGKLIGLFHLKRVDRSRPSWLSYFDGAAVDLNGFSLKTASLAAVLLVKQDDAFYAVVFGYGASLLRDGVIDERFGLRATLNAVDSGQLRSIDHKRLEAISRHTRENLSKAGGLGQFGLDVNRDLLRAVTGKPTDPKHGRRLSGADQLTVTADIPLKGLKDALTLYHKLSEQDTYRRMFPWVDHIRDIRDNGLKGKLDAELAKQLVKDASRFWLAPPEVIDWAQTAGFRYTTSKRAEVYHDLELDDYFAELGSAQDLDAGRRLKQDRIYQIRSDTDTSQHSWSVTRCLVGEIEFTKHRYVLSEGTWYRVDDDFLGKLNDFVKGIDETKIVLPDYSGNTGEREEVYNKRAWKSNTRDFALLDQNFIQYESRGKVEICDLFTKSRQLVHVKRLNGSSTLSHLFNQGTVAAELLREEPGFRRDFLSKVPPEFRWGAATDPIGPRDFEVCYAIVRRKNQPLELPFFSKLTLRTAMQQLDRLGYRRSMIGVKSK